MEDRINHRINHQRAIRFILPAREEAIVVTSHLPSNSPRRFGPSPEKAVDLEQQRFRLLISSR